MGTAKRQVDLVRGLHSPHVPWLCCHAGSAGLDQLALCPPCGGRCSWSTCPDSHRCLVCDTEASWGCGGGKVGRETAPLTKIRRKPERSESDKLLSAVYPKRFRPNSLHRSSQTQ
ncbi:hypothetical protein GN956_G21708 [Arapaima gigas]